MENNEYLKMLIRLIIFNVFVFVNIHRYIIMFKMDEFDLVSTTRIFLLLLFDENDLMKSKTCRNFPKNRIQQIYVKSSN
jgi:hypothetical protein